MGKVEGADNMLCPGAVRVTLGVMQSMEALDLSSIGWE